MYSNVFKYLEEKNNELAGAYSNLFLEHLFNPAGRSGITLLMPTRQSNPEFFNSLISGSSSLDNDEQQSTSDKLTALVIFDNLNSSDEFKSKFDDIPNGLRQHVALNLQESKNNKIVFKSGAVAVLDKTFRENRGKKTINVYVLSNGGIPTDGAPAKFKYAKSGTAGGRRRKPVAPVAKTTPTTSIDKDSVEVTRESRALRNKITREVENLYIAEQVQRNQSRGQKPPYRNAYIERVFSLIDFILINCSEETITDIVINRILPLLSIENIDLYFFVEPDLTKGAYLIPNYIIKRWDTAGNNSIDIPGIIKRIEKLYSQKQTTAAAVSNQMALFDTIDTTAREDVIDVTNARAMAGKIIKQYEKFIKTNAIGDITGVYSNDFMMYMRTHPYRKIHQDELRYTSSRIFTEIESSYMFDRERFGTLRNIIGSAMSSNLTVQGLRLLNGNTILYSLDPLDKVREINAFVNSTYFMFIPISQATIAAIKKEFETVSVPSEEANGIWLPPDKRVLMSKSYKQMNSYGDKKGFATEENHAINILRNLKKQGIVFDKSTLEAIKSMIEDGKTAEDAVRDNMNN